MDQASGMNLSKSTIFAGALLLVGVFTLAFGVGMFLFGSQKSDDVRIISATNYQDYEIAKVQVEGASVGSPVDVNTATQKELEDLPGVGQVTAGKIIAGRPYSRVEDLLIKKSVGRALFEKIGPQLTVGE